MPNANLQAKEETNRYFKWQSWKVPSRLGKFLSSLVTTDDMDLPLWSWTYIINYDMETSGRTLKYISVGQVMDSIFLERFEIRILRETTKKKRRGKLQAGALFHWDNAMAHRAMSAGQEAGIELVNTAIRQASTPATFFFFFGSWDPSGKKLTTTAKWLLRILSLTLVKDFLKRILSLEKGLEVLCCFQAATKWNVIYIATNAYTTSTEENTFSCPHSGKTKCRVAIRHPTGNVPNSLTLPAEILVIAYRSPFVAVAAGELLEVGVHAAVRGEQAPRREALVAHVARARPRARVPRHVHAQLAAVAEPAPNTQPHVTLKILMSNNLNQN